ncbi:MAG TPA: AI-2E family transporter [Bryobacteraceae bacterium]|nr:AI-2E family transporter [Bryobacteraceae bacterium]
MLGLDGRVLRAVWTVFLFALVIALIYLARHTLVIFTLAIFLAHLLAPLIDRIEGLVPRRISRTVVLAVVYLALLGAALAVLIPVGARIGEEASALAGRLPEALKADPLSRMPLPAWLEAWRPRMTGFIREQTTGFGDQVLPMLKQLGPGILSGLGNLVAVILIPILSFFFLKDGRALRQALVNSLAPGRRPVVEEILADLHLLVAQYIRALTLLAMATFAAYSIFWEIMGVPYAILLAGIAAVLELVPFVGPLTAGVLTVLVAGVSGYPHLLWIVAVLIVYRLFQDYVLSPHLMSSGVEIHPLLVLFGVLAGEQVAGIPGMFFSVPVIAGLRIVVLRMRRQKHA